MYFGSLSIHEVSLKSGCNASRCPLVSANDSFTYFVLFWSNYERCPVFGRCAASSTLNNTWKETLIVFVWRKCSCQRQRRTFSVRAGSEKHETNGASVDLAEIAETPVDVQESNVGEIVGNVSGQFVAPSIPRVTIFHPLSKLFQLNVLTMPARPSSNLSDLRVRARQSTVNHRSITRQVQDYPSNVVER